MSKLLTQYEQWNFHLPVASSCGLSVSTPWGLTEIWTRWVWKTFISRILSFILTWKRSACKKDCFIGKAYKMYIKNTAHFSTITISRKMIRELHWFISFKGRECVSRSFLSNKLILFHNKNKIWKQDGTNTASSKSYDIVHSCFKKLLWIMRWSVLAQPSVESWTVHLC